MWDKRNDKLRIVYTSTNPFAGEKPFLKVNFKMRSAIKRYFLDSLLLNFNAFCEATHKSDWKNCLETLLSQNRPSEF